jgi:dGTPase
MNLAAYACRTEQNASRTVEESGIACCDAFIIDRQRIIHSAAFRRLEYKTQVFINDVGDHYRTRLTHTLEVAQIARYVARKLELNEDMAEIVALAHDLGHPPFGHAGERALDFVAVEHGGFDHNFQTLRVVTYLEQKHADFEGLNLTKASLDAIAKHNGPLSNTDLIAQILLPAGIDAGLQPCIEAQIASLADDIAYVCHDLEDGVRAGMINVAQLATLPLLDDLYVGVTKANTMLDELLRALKTQMVDDLIACTQARVGSLNIQNTQDVYASTCAIASFSPNVETAKNVIKAFLMQNVYQHYQVNRMMLKAQDVIMDIFKRYMQYPMCMPTLWQNRILSCQDEAKKARIIVDYIAGMTDRFAYEEHRKLFF